MRRVNAKSQIDFLLSAFGLESVLDNLISQYSHGMRQKLSLAAALIGEPKYLILDEALNGFDPISQYNAKNMLLKLAENGHTILLSSHVLELVENWCQDIIIFNTGIILAEYTMKEIEDIKSRTGKAFSDHFVALIQNSKQS